MANPNPKPPPVEKSPWRRDMYKRRFAGQTQPDPNSDGSKQTRDALIYENLPKKPPGKK